MIRLLFIVSATPVRHATCNRNNTTVGRAEKKKNPKIKRIKPKYAHTFLPADGVQQECPEDGQHLKHHVPVSGRGMGRGGSVG